MEKRIEVKLLFKGNEDTLKSIRNSLIETLGEYFLMKDEKVSILEVNEKEQMIRLV